MLLSRLALPLRQSPVVISRTILALAPGLVPAVDNSLGSFCVLLARLESFPVAPDRRKLGVPQTTIGEGRLMLKRSWLMGALALAWFLPDLPAGAQGDRRAAAEAYARVVDYPLLIEKAATRRAAELPAAEREAFIAFITKEVDFDMTRFYAISAMVDLFEASELAALAAFAATPDGRSALAKLPALGAVLTPIVERQIADAERRFRQR
ncbi:MAG: hypothetical protein K0S35_2451 [Geminicoccaceae bacterium]|jgi:hypothetical protein|nr:hypothetical protein [Geminicoccaceae bacterium]